MKKVHREGIANEILMHIRANRKHAGELYLQDIVGMDKEGNEVHMEDKIADEAENVEAQVTFKLQAARLYDAVKRVLQGREKVVIVLRYGLANHNAMTQKEIADMLNISRSYVSRIEKKALAKIGEEMA